MTFFKDIIIQNFVVIFLKVVVRRYGCQMKGHILGYLNTIFVFRNMNLKVAKMALQILVLHYPLKSTVENFEKNICCGCYYSANHIQILAFYVDYIIF